MHLFKHTALALNTRQKNNARNLTIFLVTGSTTALYLNSRKPQIHCSPTFNGIPVSATFLLHQSHNLFTNQFPGLEMSPVFAINYSDEFTYKETGMFADYGWPTGCIVTVPVFERLSKEEEVRLGNNGIRYDI